MEKKALVVIIFFIFLLLIIGLPDTTKIENFQYESGEAKFKSSIKLAAYNIHFGSGSNEVFESNKYLDEVAKILSEVDIAVIQEVDINIQMSNFSNQLKYLAKKLEIKHSSFLNNWNVILFPKTKPIFLNQLKTGHGILSKYPLKSDFYLFDKPKDSSLWHKIFFLWRTQHYTDIELEYGKIRVFNIHLEGENKKDRIDQAKQLKKLVESSPYPTILAGDFNALMGDLDDPTINIIKSTGLNEITSNEFTFPSHSPDKKLDYVFVSEGIKVKHVKVLNTLASDHLPIILEFSLDVNKE